MPLNNSYDEQAVIQAIASALETFYGTLIEKIDGLNIQKVMKRKNPYLYRAKAMQSATEIVDSVLTAFVSSSEETIFGNCFFEPIAIAASGGNKALAEGIDIMIQNNETNTISAIAVKSGPSVFNADSKKRQEQNFTAASKLAQQAKDYVQEQMDRLEDQDYAQSWAVSEGRYLMRPLIYDDYSNSRIEPIDEDVLIHRLAHLKCLALENEGVRQIVSAEDVAELEEINIFECEMTRAGEYLLKEVRSSATLSSLIGVVCKDNFLAGVKNVICNIDMGNLLHQYALKNKEVSKIEVAHKERRIHVTYSCKNDLWYEFDLRNRGLAARSLYIPKKNMIISGLKEEIGVKNFGGIYIQSNTELCEYLIKVIGAFQSEDTEENKILLEVFLSYVFDNKVLEVAYKQDVNTSNMFKQLLEERFVRVSNELIEKMWAKIDTQEFVNKILTKNYTLYSIDNWSRKNDSI